MVELYLKEVQECNLGFTAEKFTLEYLFVESDTHNKMIIACAHKYMLEQSPTDLKVFEKLVNKGI